MSPGHTDTDLDFVLLLLSRLRLTSTVPSLATSAATAPDAERSRASVEDAETLERFGIVVVAVWSCGRRADLRGVLFDMP